MRKIGPVYILNESINDLNNVIRNNFNYYEFIGVSKINGNLIVKIIKNNKIPNNKKPTNELVASKTGYVLGMEIINGNKCFDLFQTVKAGDVLLYGTNVSGKVFARCIEVKEFVISKEEEYLTYTNNHYTKRYLKFKNIEKDENIKYELFYKDSKIIYRIGKICLVEDTYYELENKSYIKNETDVKAYLINLLKYDFYQNHLESKESVLNIQILKIEEDAEKFFIKVCVTSVEQIAKVKEWVIHSFLFIKECDKRFFFWYNIVKIWSDNLNKELLNEEIIYKFDDLDLYRSLVGPMNVNLKMLMLEIDDVINEI